MPGRQSDGSDACDDEFWRGGLRYGWKPAYWLFGDGSAELFGLGGGVPLGKGLKGT